MDLTYGTCSSDGFDTLYAIQKQYFLHYEDPTLVDMHATLQQLKRNLQANITSYSTVIWEENVVAYYHIVEDYDLYWNLTFLYVLPKYRKQGIGEKILEHLLQITDDPIRVNLYLKDYMLVDFFESHQFQIKKILSKSRMTLERK